MADFYNLFVNESDTSLTSGSISALNKFGYEYWKNVQLEQNANCIACPANSNTPIIIFFSLLNPEFQRFLPSPSAKA